MSTNLRQATAKIAAVGVLAEKDLKLENVNGVDIISGSLTLKISDTDSIQFRVRQAAKKSDGKKGYTNEDNRAFEGVKRVYDEYNSIASVGEAEADKVRIGSGQFRPYYSIQSDREVMGYQAAFFSRVPKDENVENSAEFDVELFIKAIVPEIYSNGDSQGEETGRVIVKGLMPTYDGIEPVELVAPKEDGVANAILETYAPGQTVEFFGDVINRKIEKTTTVPVRIGKPKVTTSVTYTNELVITGASEPYEDEEGKKSYYNAEAIKQAEMERKTRIEEQKAKAKNGGSKNATSAPASSGRKVAW